MTRPTTSRACQRSAVTDWLAACGGARDVTGEINNMHDPPDAALVVSEDREAAVSDSVLAGS